MGTTDIFLLYLVIILVLPRYFPWKESWS